MYQSQRFALDNIYCAPSQDAQFAFKLVRVNKPTLPCKGKVHLYNTTKHLPNQTHFFQVFVVGNIPTIIMNLLSQKEAWFRDQWLKVSDDMISRNFLFSLYNQDGVVYPRQNVYYSFIDERSLIIAQEVPESFLGVYPVKDFQYLHVYSNAWFQSLEFNGLPVKTGIDYTFAQVENNLQKVALQTWISQRKANGGDVMVFVNGYYSDNVNLNIPDYSYVEVIYDQSIISKEKFPLEGLHTFDSTKDDKLKYVIYRQKQTNKIQFFDDTTVFVNDTSGLVSKGLLYYKHKDHSMRNITDKDFSLNSAYVNNTAMKLGESTTSGFGSKEIVVFVRKDGLQRELVYSAMKLHEFYKLPDESQFNVMIDNGHSVDVFRAEYLENSPYFALTSEQRMSGVTPQLALDAVGYNGITHYLADTPVQADGGTIEVPELYQWRSLAFEYDQNGNYKGMFPTNGPLYSCASPNTRFVEFIHGEVPLDFGRLYDHNETIVLNNEVEEYVVLSAYFTGVTRESQWEDITNTPKAVRNGNTLVLSEATDKKVKLVYLNQVNVYDLDVDLSDGSLYFPLTVKEDRGTGVAMWPCDVPYLEVSVYMNEKRLTMGVDWFYNFPYISVTNKKYIRYDQPVQKLHIRCTGVTTDPTGINLQEVRGFVNNGVLTRNKRYDIREDRVYAVFVDGKIYDRNNVMYSEQDNTVRLAHPLNGLPYTLTDRFIPVKPLTGQDTLPYYRENIRVNKKIADLYDLIFPEPALPQFNVIPTAHYIFSPTVSKIVNDIVRGVIPESLYSTPYDDGTIIQMLDSDYQHLLRIDPVKFNMQDTLVEIHPHLGNATVTLSVLQYRFVTNVIRIITNNKPTKINLSGYLSVSA